jgi:hypothetical protein
LAVGYEILRDWRNPGGGDDFGNLLHEYLPFYGNLIESYNVQSKLNLNQN